MDVVKELVNEALCKVHEDTRLELQLTNLWAQGVSIRSAKRFIKQRTPPGLSRDSMFALIKKIWGEKKT